MIHASVYAYVRATLLLKGVLEQKPQPDRHQRLLANREAGKK